jgi:hypothetical protein
MNIFKINKQSRPTTLVKKNELLMLLIRPNLVNIFSNNSDVVLDRFGAELDRAGVLAFYIMTKHGIQPIQRNDLNWLHMFPILFITDNGRIGYTITMRLDMQIFLNQILKHSGFTMAVYPQYFKDNDVIFIADGIYTNRLSYSDQNTALKIRNDGFTSELNTANIVYSATTAELKVMASLRRIEAAAELILFEHKKDPAKKQIEELPKLPFDLYSDLSFCFDRARDSIKGDSQGKK